MVSLDHGQDTYLKGIGGILVVLIVLHFPIIGLINVIPIFKEVIIGAVVVVALIETTDLVDGAVFSLITGMVAAVVFNVLRTIFLVVVGATGFLGGGGAGAGQIAGGLLGSGALGGVVGLVNFVGVIFFSPIGYALGGALGALLNDTL